MKTIARNAARTAVALAAVGVIAILNGCGAAPDGSSENVEATAAAWSTLPASTCTLIVGNSGPGNNALVLGLGITADTNPNVVAFRSAISAVVPGQYTYQVVGLGGARWNGYDVTRGDPTAVTNVVNQYASVSPVFAGYLSCSYDWADWQGRRPYAPTLIAVYDPKGCTSC